MTTHYTYKIEFETGHFYFGVRSCECLPKDDPYLGSPSYHKDYWNNYEPKKYIISTHLTREEAAEYESVLIDYGWSINRQLSLNASNMGSKFSVYGKSLSEKQKSKISQANKGKGSKSFEIVSPEGRLIKSKNITEFASEKGLTFTSLSKVLKGDQLQHKGYTKCLKAHKIYLEAYKNRGLIWDKKWKKWKVLWRENAVQKTAAFINKVEALEFRNTLEKTLNREFQIQVKNWKNLVK